jgi:hypothetical protein
VVGEVDIQRLLGHGGWTGRTGCWRGVVWSGV